MARSHRDAPWPDGADDVLRAVERQARASVLCDRERITAACDEHDEYEKWERRSADIRKAGAEALAAFRARDWPALVRWARRENARIAKERA